MIIIALFLFILSLQAIFRGPYWQQEDRIKMLGSWEEPLGGGGGKCKLYPSRGLSMVHLPNGHATMQISHAVFLACLH